MNLPVMIAAAIAGLLAGICVFRFLASRMSWFLVLGTFGLVVVAMIVFVLPNGVIAMHFIPHLEIANIDTVRLNAAISGMTAGIFFVLEGLPGWIWGILVKRRARLNGGEAHAS